jgi:hypothetical protein
VWLRYVWSGGERADVTRRDAELAAERTRESGEAATGAGKGGDQLMSDFLNLMLDPTAGGGGGASSGVW